MIKRTGISFIVGLILVTASIAQQSPYVPLIIEPVSVCNYPYGYVTYAGIPSSPYAPNYIQGQVTPSSQYYSSLPVSPGQPPGSFELKSTCNQNGNIELPVCGGLIGYGGYGGIVSVDKYYAMTNGPSNCIQFQSGDFFSYNFGIPNLTGFLDMTLLDIQINYPTLTTASITITPYVGTAGMFLVGPLPLSNIVSSVTCGGLPPCVLTAVVQKPQQPQFPPYNTDVYHVYIADVNGSMTDVSVAPVLIQ